MLADLSAAAPSPPAHPAIVTMSTVDIADLTGKRHQHVLRDARRMLAELYPAPDASKSGAVEFKSTYLDGKGEARPCLLLPEREVMILITGYSVPLRARVIDRLRELEAKLAKEALPALAPPAPSEPPAELFPPNALERFTGTALSQIKRLGTSIRDSVWQAKTAMTERIEAMDQKAIARDRFVAEQTIEARKDIRQTSNDVREVMRFLTREPNWVTMSEMLRCQRIEAQGLVSRLSKEAEAWFTARGRRLQIASPSSNLRATWFERGHLLQWWQEDGERLYRQFLAKRSPPPLRLVPKAAEAPAP